MLMKDGRSAHGEGISGKIVCSRCVDTPKCVRQLKDLNDMGHGSVKKKG